MKLVCLLIIVWVNFTGCSSTRSEFKKKINNELAKLGNKSLSFEIPSRVSPPPIQVGQWIKVKTEDKKGRVGIVTYKIVDEQDGAFWYEVEQLQYSGHSIIKILTVIDRENIANTEIRQVVQWHGKGQPVIIPEQTLNFTRSLFKNSLNLMTANWNTQFQDDIQVSAGLFKQAYKIGSKISLGIVSHESDIWVHPDVPINGIVKAIAKSDFKIELVDFGFTGATSFIP